MNVTGVWLRKIGDDVQVLVEIEGAWRVAIEELVDGPFSHIVEEAGMANAPTDPVATGA